MKFVYTLIIIFFSIIFAYGQSNCTVVITYTPASCSSCCDGAAQAHIPENCAPYQFTWVPLGPTMDSTAYSLCPGTTYTVIVQDNGNPTCCGTMTGTVTMTSSTSIDELYSNDKAIYPNPNNGTFIIKLNGTQSQNVQIFDANGKIILSQIINSSSRININDLPEGVYSVRIIDDKSIVNKKLIITK